MSKLNYGCYGNKYQLESSGKIFAWWRNMLKFWGGHLNTDGIGHHREEKAWGREMESRWFGNWYMAGI
jgi:hypothetical protein